MSEKKPHITVKRSDLWRAGAHVCVGACARAGVCVKGWIKLQSLLLGYQKQITSDPPQTNKHTPHLNSTNWKSLSLMSVPHVWGPLCVCACTRTCVSQRAGTCLLCAAWLKHDGWCPICFPWERRDSQQRVYLLPPLRVRWFTADSPRLCAALFSFLPCWVPGSELLKKYYALLTKYSDSHLPALKECQSV